MPLQSKLQPGSLLDSPPVGLLPQVQRWPSPGPSRPSQTRPQMPLA
jgi:hypothetical protein